jgi:hypothetical protein
VTNNTISVIGGAMPKTDRAAIMTRVWAIFQQISCYLLLPAIKFVCTAEVKSSVRVAVIGGATLTNSIASEGFNDHWQSARANIHARRNFSTVLRGQKANHRTNARGACNRP